MDEYVHEGTGNTGHGVPTTDDEVAQWFARQMGTADGVRVVDRPGAAMPRHQRPADAQWWLRRIARREEFTGALPPGVWLRIEDTRLDVALDRESSPEGVRAIIKEFNRRVVEARRDLQGGPPVITPTRDADREVERWRERRHDRQSM